MGLRFTARFSAERSLQAGTRADAESGAEGGVHAHSEGWGTIRVLGTELAARETAVVDAHLVGPAGEAGAHAATGPAALERAILAAYRPPAAGGVVGALRSDAVSRRPRAVVETRPSGRP